MALGWLVSLGPNNGDFIDLPMIGLNGILTRELLDLLATNQVCECSDQILSLLK